MRIHGRRSDGAYCLSLGGGQVVLLRGRQSSVPFSDREADAYGPWSPVTPSVAERQAVTKQLDASKTVPVSVFALSLSFDEQRDRVQAALRQRLGLPASALYPTPYGMSDIYIPQNGLGPDWVVWCQTSSGQHLGLAYSISDDGTVQFVGNPEPVHPSWEGLSDIAGDDEALNASEAYQAMAGQRWFGKFLAHLHKDRDEYPQNKYPSERGGDGGGGGGSVGRLS